MAKERLPAARDRLRDALVEAERTIDPGEGAGSMLVAEVMEVAKSELARGVDGVPPEGVLESEPQREPSRTLEPISYLRDCASEHHRLRRCVEQGERSRCILSH